MKDTDLFLKNLLTALSWVFLVAALVWLTSCKITVPVDSAGQPLGQATVQPSESGEMEAVTVDPSGEETPVNLDVEGPSADEIGAAISAGTSTLPPPWNLLGLLGGAIPLFFRKDEK